VIFANVLLALTLASNPVPPGGLVSADSLMVALRKGGYTILWRHTATNQANADAPGFPNTERWQQRNLSDRGVADARAIGVILKAKGIPIGDVITSPMFRTRETAEYAFGRVTAVSPLLIAMQPSPEETNLIAAQPAPGTNRVLVTHHYIIERDAPGVKPGDVNEGEAAVLRTVGGKVETVGIINMADWNRMHEAAGVPPAGPDGPPVRVAIGPLVIPPSLQTPSTAVVGEYLRAFNSGDPAKMRAFFERSAVPNPARTIEQRLEIYATLLKDLGSLEIVSVEVGADNQVVVKTKTSTAKASTLTFALEAVAPYRLKSLNIQTGPQ
jgi:phosphohistidine phosphatase SixA